MANAFMDSYRNRLLGVSTVMASVPDLDGDVIKVVLYDEAVTPATSTMELIAELNAADIIKTATLGTITLGTVGVGVFDAANTTFASTTGDVAEAIVFYDDTLTSDPLLAYMDTFSGGMPVTPNGGDIVVTWSGSGIWTI